LAQVPSNARWLRIRNAPRRKHRPRLVRRIILLDCDVLKTERERKMDRPATGNKVGVRRVAVVLVEVRGWMANVRRFLLSFKSD